MLTELETQNRKVAHVELITAIWKGAEASRLLTLARDAGLSGDQADALIGRIREGKDQLAQVRQLPRLRKDAASAQHQLARAQSRLDAEIAKLENQAEDASIAASGARQAVYAAEDSARRLLALHDEGLLPESEVPNELRRLIERRVAEGQLQTCDRARVVAHDVRDRCRAAVRTAAANLAHMPIMPPLEQRICENMLRDRLKAAQGALAEAESRLQKAEAAADTARRAIP